MLQWQRAITAVLQCVLSRYRVPGIPTGFFSPLLLNIAEVNVFFESNFSYHSNTAMLSASVEPVKLHPNR